jgi:hypothetical protein
MGYQMKDGNNTRPSQAWKIPVFKGKRSTIHEKFQKIALFQGIFLICLTFPSQMLFSQMSDFWGY